MACVVRVWGALAPRWADRLGGLAITVCDRSRTGDAVTTELRGVLLDQAALLGVLTTLFDLGLPLVSVACAPAEAPADRDLAGRPAPSPRCRRFRSAASPMVRGSAGSPSSTPATGRATDRWCHCSGGTSARRRRTSRASIR